MAIDIVSLVESDLEPVFLLDAGLQIRIPERVEAIVAVKGWTLLDLDDAKCVYVAALTTKAFIPRLLLKFAQEIKKAKGGKAETEFVEAIKYLQALQDQVEEAVQSYAADASPEDAIIADVRHRWPGVGVVTF